jgi:hypothetical protein
LVDHTLPQQVAQTNGTLPLAQTGYDAGPQYPYQINPSNVAASDAFRSGGFNADTSYYDPSLNFPYVGTETELAFPMAPMPTAWDFNNIQNVDQSYMSIMDGAQLNPAFYPAPAPAPMAAPAPVTNAASIRCPQGCAETFGRNVEMRRHMMKHEVPRFKCPIYDCPMTFYRKDKLQDHAKKGHRGRASLTIR